MKVKNIDYLMCLIVILSLVLIVSPTNALSFSDGVLTNNDGIQYKTDINGVVTVNDNRYVAFAMKGTVGGTPYTYTSMDYTWTWTTEQNGNDYIFYATNNDPSLLWNQTWYFYEDAPMKIEHYLKNQLSVDITNTEMYYLISVSDTDTITYNDIPYLVGDIKPLYIQEDLTANVAKIKFNFEYDFDFTDIVNEGFIINEFYLGSGSVVDHPEIDIMAVGFTKNGGVFPAGAEVYIDPTITVGGATGTYTQIWNTNQTNTTSNTIAQTLNASNMTSSTISIVDAKTCQDGVYACVPTDGLAAYWRADNNWLDSAGSNDGTWYGNTTANWTTGKYNNAGLFDGVNDYVNVGTDIFQQSDFVNGITIESWILPNSLTTEYTIFSIENRIKIRLSTNGQCVFYMYDDSDKNVYSTDLLKTTKLNHCVGIWNGTHSYMYLNGVFQPSIISSSIGSIDAVSRINTIGSDHVLGFHFNGTIDDIRIYNRSLSPEEIRQSYLIGVQNIQAKYSTNSTWSGYLNGTSNTPLPYLTGESYTQIDWQVPDNQTSVDGVLMYNISQQMEFKPTLTVGIGEDTISYQESASNGVYTQNLSYTPSVSLTNPSIRGTINDAVFKGAPYRYPTVSVITTDANWTSSIWNQWNIIHSSSYLPAGVGNWYNSTILYQPGTIFYNATHPYLNTIYGSEIYYNRSVVATDNIYDTAISSGTTNLTVTYFSNSDNLFRRNFTTTGNTLTSYTIRNQTGWVRLHKSDGTYIVDANGTSGSATFTATLAAGSYVITTIPHQNTHYHAAISNSTSATGTFISGKLWNTYYNDALITTYREYAISDFNITFKFDGSDINPLKIADYTLYIDGNYDGNPAHYMSVMVLNNMTGVYDLIGTMDNSPTELSYEFNFQGIYDDRKYKNATNITTIKLVHFPSESNNHYLYIDRIVLFIDEHGIIESYLPTDLSPNTEPDINQTFSAEFTRESNGTWYVDGDVYSTFTDSNSSNITLDFSNGNYNVTLWVWNNGVSYNEEYLTWSWTISTPKYIPLPLYIMMTIILIGAFVGTIRSESFIGMIFGVLAVMISYFLAKVSINGQLVESYTYVTTEGVIITGYNVIQVSAMGWILTFVGIISFLILLMHVINEYNYQIKPELESEL